MADLKGTKTEKNHFRKTKKRLSHVSGGTISVFGGRCNVYGGCQKDDGEL